MPVPRASAGGARHAIKKIVLHVSISPFLVRRASRGQVFVATICHIPFHEIVTVSQARLQIQNKERTV